MKIDWPGAAWAGAIVVLLLVVFAYTMRDLARISFLIP